MNLKHFSYFLMFLFCQYLLIYFFKWLDVISRLNKLVTKIYFYFFFLVPKIVLRFLNKANLAFFPKRPQNLGFLENIPKNIYLKNICWTRFCFRPSNVCIWKSFFNIFCLKYQYKHYLKQEQNILSLLDWCINYLW